MRKTTTTLCKMEMFNFLMAKIHYLYVKLVIIPERVLMTQVSFFQDKELTERFRDSIKYFAINERGIFTSCIKNSAMLQKCTKRH